MKNKFAAFLLALILLCSFLGGCAPKETTTNNEGEQVVVVEGDNFTPKQVASFYDSEHDTTYIYLKDEITNVMYLCMEEDSRLNGYDGTNGLTVMMDPETGGPLLYDRWLEYVEQNDVNKDNSKSD